MKNRFKDLPVKKRYILLGLLALELASIPAAAQIIDKVVFEVKPLVTAVAIPTPQPGKQRFLVAANAPFSVAASDMVGEMTVSVHRSGNINGNRFGDNAQLPGQPQSCAALTGPQDAQIYRAEQKTATQRGTAVSQAVVFEFSYDPLATPEITFSAGEKASLPTAQPCLGRTS